MAKTIKRVGIIFFVLVVSLLMAVGSVFVTDITNNNNLSANDLTVSNGADINNRAVIPELPTPVEEVVLTCSCPAGVTCTCGGMEAKWSEAARKSHETGGNVKVVLGKDWIGRDDSHYIKILGVGDYFSCGRLSIENSIDMTIDLNGHTINRGRPEGLADTVGSVIIIFDGRLNIIDSKYDATQVEEVCNTYGNDKELLVQKLKELPFGKVTGGWTSGNGGFVNIYANGGTNVNAHLNIYGGIIMGNYAGSGGGVHIYNKATLNVYNGLFLDNLTGNQAGAINCADEANCNIYGGYFVGNTTNGSGGGGAIMYHGKDNSKLRILENANFYYNESTKSHAGAIMLNNESNLLMTNCRVIGNKSKNFAGGMSVTNYAMAKITNCTFTGNITGTDAAAVHVGLYSYCQLTSCTINENVSTNTGAGIYCNEGSKVAINGCTISDNVANKTAGGIVAQISSVVTISDTIIRNNTANSTTGGGGGGLYANSYSVVRLDGTSVVSNNIAQSIGGGILLDKKANFMMTSTVRIYDNKIKDNNSGSDIYLPSGKQLEIIEPINIEAGKKIYIQLSGAYDKFTPFTSEFAYNNPSVDPNSIFACSGDSSKIAVLKDGEVIFDDADKSIYDFVYLENGVRKNYRDNDKLYGYNDSAITNKVLGKIAPETTVDTFVAELKFDTTKLQIFNKDILVYDKGNKLVDGVIGSGWKMVYDGADIYLSVLGDVTGDGRIDATDITYLRRIANGEIDDLSPAVQLAAMVDNRGKITSIDAEILRAICKYETTIDMYF